MSTTAVHPYIDALLSGTRDLPTSGHAWLNDRRGAALERANALSVPTTRDEDWRFTDLTPLTRLQLATASAAAELPAEAIQPFIVTEAGARIVFVDGVFAPALSVMTDDACAPRVETLASALKNHAHALEPYLAMLAEYDRNVFVALNTARLREGAALFVSKNSVCQKPVHVLHIATQPNAAVYPRALVIVESGADCSFIEEHAALSQDAYLTNGVTEVSIGAGARLRHIRLQRESGRAFHIANCAVAIGKDASYISHTVTLGARLSRYELNVSLDAEGASAQIDGLALISSRQHADTHTLIDHRQPNGRSEQLHKTIVDGAAHAVFNGKIFVRPGAQQTDSSQQSRNLLLSDKATVDTKPQLEIFADDVKCAHGATVGQLDAEQLFYLVSRGLTHTAARNLLTYAFAASVIERIPVRSVVERFERAVMAQTGAEA